MNGLELVVAFLAGVVMGGALDFFVLPLLVDAWTDRRVGMGDAALTLVLVVLLDLDRLQLAAYAHAGFIARIGHPERYPLLEVTRFGIVHVTDGGTRLDGRTSPSATGSPSAPA